MTTPPRTRNPRGEGGRLRADLIAAANAILEEDGSEDAVTLRAVARRAGVTPMSIYPHFADVGALLLEVVRQAFDGLAAALRQAGDESLPPAARLEAVCRAYVDYARAHPDRYRVMFGRHGRRRGEAMTAPRPIERLGGAEAFGLLVEAVARTGAADPTGQATAIWVAIHGMVSLRDAIPAFPWPEDLLEVLLRRLGATPTA